MNAKRLHTSPALKSNRGFLPPDVNLKSKTPALMLEKFIGLWHNLRCMAHAPISMIFEGQEKGESVILLLRAHIVTLVPAGLMTFFLIFVPFLISIILNLIGFALANSLSAVQSLLLIIFWYLVVFGYAFYQFIFWYFNVYLVTNERIVDFDFKGLLHKETSYAKLNQIQDVSPKMIGFFGTFFHYGNVYIQTAAERPEFEFHHVPRPNDVASVIIEQIRHEEAEAPGVVA